METKEGRRLNNDQFKQLLLDNSSKENEIPFTGDVFVGNIDLTQPLLTRILPIVFKNCTFQAELFLSNCSSINKIEFIECIFEGPVKCIHTATVIFFKDNCHFKNSVFVKSEGNFPILINGCTIDNDFTMSGSFDPFTIIKNINTDVKDTTAKFKLEGAIFREIQFENIYVSEFEIIGHTNFQDATDFKKLTAKKFSLNHVIIGLLVRIDDCDINSFSVDNIHPFNEQKKHRHLEIKNNARIKDGNFCLEMFEKTTIIDSHFESLRWWATNEKDSLVIIENTDANSLVFDKMFNYGLMIFRNVTIPKNGLLKIQSSALGKTDFILCSFVDAQFEFENSKLTEIFLSETDFPFTVKTNKNDNSRQAQLAFGQLHTAFEKQGDTVRALEYQGREIKAYYKDLHLFRKSWKFINEIKISLWLNYISNNFGKSWSRGLLFSISIGIIFFYSLVISTNEYCIGFPVTWFWENNLSASFLKFMNPLRFFDTESLFKINNDISSITLSGWSYVWDYLGRVFLAYGFYQLIQAFRRFGRK